MEVPRAGCGAGAGPGPGGQHAWAGVVPRPPHARLRPPTTAPPTTPRASGKGRRSGRDSCTYWHSLGMTSVSVSDANASPLSIKKSFRALKGVVRMGRAGWWGRGQRGT